MASGQSRWRLLSNPRQSQGRNSKPWRWESDPTKPKGWTAGQSRNSGPSCRSNGTNWRRSSED
eukprot:3593211-Heterocapsa_arctica.AAC.1